MIILSNTSRPPEARPWIALPAINMPIFLARPHMRLPMKKMPTAPIKAGFRPKMSLSLPQDAVEAACPRRKAEPIQVKPADEWKASAIVGKAVVTMVTSRAARKTDSCTSTSARKDSNQRPNRVHKWQERRRKSAVW
jgi:hypothetical protein